MISESLPSTTDRDLCIRLCDLLSGSSDDWFASTDQHTVIHYACDNRSRVSSKGSIGKVQGLKKFYHKYSPRMSDAEQSAFKERATKVLGCDEAEFMVDLNQDSINQSSLEAWSGDQLRLNRDTLDQLPTLKTNTSIEEKTKKRVIFGTITSDINRIIPLLNDLSCASESFDPFVIIFANGLDTELAESIEKEVKERNLQGHIFSRSSLATKSILEQCKDVEVSLSNDKLPIAISQTVLQVFIYNLPQLQDADAVCIIDDDKRLVKGWTPFTGGTAADILIGRDLRTPKFERVCVSCSIANHDTSN